MARIILNETPYFGKGAISHVATEVKARGLKKVLLVTDKDLVKFNVATKVMKVMDDAGIPYTVYDDIKANPTIENRPHGVGGINKKTGGGGAAGTGPSGV